MAEQTTMQRIYVDDARWLNELRRKLSGERNQDVTIADVVHMLREAYEAQEVRE